MVMRGSKPDSAFERDKAGDTWFRDVLHDLRVFIYRTALQYAATLQNVS